MDHTLLIEMGFDEIDLKVPVLPVELPAIEFTESSSGAADRMIRQLVYEDLIREVLGPEITIAIETGTKTVEDSFVREMVGDTIIPLKKAKPKSKHRQKIENRVAHSGLTEIADVCPDLLEELVTAMENYVDTAVRESRKR